MGNLYQRFTLQNATLGTLQIKRPGGWRDATFQVKRGENHEFNTDYVTDLRFSGKSSKGDGGREYIRRALSEQGVNAEIVFIYEVSTDKKTWKEEYRGILFFEDYDRQTENADFIEIPITKEDFKTVFGERRNKKINLNDRIGLDGGNIRNYMTNDINNTGRALEQVFDAEYSNDDPSLNVVIEQIGASFVYYNVAYQKINRDDLGAFTFTSVNKFDSVSLFQARNDGEFTVTANYTADLLINTIGAGNNPDYFEFKTVYRIDDGEEVILKEDRFDADGNKKFEYNGYGFSSTFTISLKKGEKFFLYGLMVTNNIQNQPRPIWRVKINSGFLKVDGLTNFRPTVTKTYTIHDAFAILCESMTGIQDSFYSEYLGNRATQFQKYPENGEWSFLAAGTGYNLREINQDFSISWNQLYDDLNAVTPLCISFETINGKPKVRVEHISYAYSNEIVNNFQAKYINESIDKESYFKSIISGYEKWEAENVNGLNEPNGKREYSTALRVVGKEYKIMSSIIASSQIMEVTRRKVDEKTTDFQFDKDIFFFALKRTTSFRGRPTGMRELENNENYSQLNGIFQPENIVNLRLSPAMNVLRHGVLINAGLLKYPGTVYKLTASEGNDTMTTQTNKDFAGNFDNQLLAENQDIVWSYAERSETVPLFSGFILTCRIPMSFSEFSELKNEIDRDENGRLNKHKAIEVTARGVTKRGWIMEMEYDQSDEPVAIVKLRESNNEIFGLTPELSTKMAFEDGTFILLGNNRFLNK